MGKLTKRQTKLHDEALVLIHSDKQLSHEDRAFCFKNYNPMAAHNVSKGGIFFTPHSLAWEFAVMSQPKGAVIDLCAGIGVLTHTVLEHDYGGWMGREGLRGDIKRMVCIEQNAEFVEVGKRLVPDAEWHCGSVFDLELLLSLGEFACAISNPPYGNLPYKNHAPWLKVRGPMQWRVIEIALRLAYNGGMFILPHGDSDYDPDRGYRAVDKSTREKHLEPHFPGVRMNPAAVDPKVYQKDWVGVFPNVLIIDVSTDDVAWDTPYGFEDVRKQGELF